MSNPWFRLYAEFATDPKVQMMTEATQRRYIMLLCLRCSNGDVTLQDEEVAFQLRISIDEYRETKALLMAKDLINEVNQPTAWNRRQFVSDSSAARVAAHRAKKKRECNVTVTPPDTDTDTDTEEKTKGKRKRFSPPSISEVEAYCRERGNSVSAAKFWNHYQAKGWMVGKNKMKDWKAAVHTWEDTKPKQDSFMAGGI